MRGRLKKSNSGKRADGSLRRDTVARRRADAQARRRRRRAARARRSPPTRGRSPRFFRGARSSRAARRAAGQGERIVAANVDQVVVMFAAAKPEPHPRMLDRFLVIAEGNDLPARIIINKIDLVGEAGGARALRRLRARGISGPLHGREERHRPRGGALDARGPPVGAHRAVGSGKVVAAQRAVSRREPARGRDQRIGQQGPAHDGRGVDASASRRRTAATSSTRRGFAKSGLWALSAEQLDRCFPEIRAVRDQCRFADCSHIVEPDCAVRERGSGRCDQQRNDTTVI